MKILIVRYDNGYAVTLTEKIAHPVKQDELVDCQIKRVFENKEQMSAWVMEKL